MSNKLGPLLKGRIRMAVGSCLADIAGYLSSSISDDTEIPDECFDQLLERLSDFFEREITKAKLDSSGPWSVGSLSRGIFEKQDDFPSRSA